MPNPIISEIQDKTGNVFDIAAKRFSGTRTVQMTGDVTANESGWNGSDTLTLAATIASGAVITDKLATSAVTAVKIDDEAVTLAKIASSAMNGTVQDNDSKLATHAAVKTYVDSQISGQGTYLGKHTVAEINAFETANLHNGDRVMVSDSGTINLGPGGVGFDVVAGEDLILYKAGSVVQWDSMDGNFKTKQTAVSDPTASGTTLTVIDTITQDANGEILPTKKTIQDGTTAQKGVVQLTNSTSSTSTTTAATPNSVKTVNDALSSHTSDTDNPHGVTKAQVGLGNVDNTSDANKPISTATQTALNAKADKVSGATSGNFAGLDANGNLTDSGSKASDFKTKQTAVADPTASGMGLEFIATASQNANGEMAVTKKTVQDGTTSQKGVVQLEDSTSSTSTTKAATPNSVKTVYDLANTKQDALPTSGDATDTYAINISGNAATASLAERSKQAYVLAVDGEATTATYRKLGHLMTSNGGCRDVIMLVTSPDTLSMNIPATYLVSVTNRMSTPRVRYLSLGPLQNESVRMASFGYVLYDNNDIELAMYCPNFGGNIKVQLLTSHAFTLDEDFTSFDGTGYVVGDRYTNVSFLGSAAIGSASIPTYVDENGTVRPVTAVGIANGGTGATDAATARTNLGAQAVISDLVTIRSGAAKGATALQPEDVTSSYSATGTAPVNGTAVAEAVAGVTQDTTNMSQVTAAALAELAKRIEGIEQRENYGDLLADSIRIQDFPLVGGKAMVLVGTSAPTDAPDYSGQVYVDTVNAVVYVAKGERSASDWQAQQAAFEWMTDAEALQLFNDAWDAA